MSGLDALGLGKGVYSASDASRLTGVSTPRVRRWFEGYSYSHCGESRSMPPVAQGEYGLTADDPLQLSFLDLIEVRFVDVFLQFGVGWKELRVAARNAANLLQTTHPFSTCQFKTDGRRIFAEITDELQDIHLLQLRDRQHVFRTVVSPMLRDLEFGDEFVRRWWPLGLNRRVVVDPDLCFGQPACAASGVPAVTVARFAEVNGVASAAAWFEIERREVRDAMLLQERLAA